MWIDIFNEIIYKNVDVIYIAIGSSLKYYNNIVSKNNQQYPCFLEKFKKKLIILIDPELEKPLKIQEHFDDLEIIDLGNLRIFKNESLIIYAINEVFYYDFSNLYSLNEKKNENYSIIINLIKIILETKKKLIFQDYTGNDTTNFYCDLINIFDKTKLLKYVNFDVTQEDSGCFINISENMIKYDSDNNFIQEKFLKLVDIKTSEKFNKTFKKRIDLLNYEIIGSYTKSLNQNIIEFINIQNIRNMCVVYDFDSRFIDIKTNIQLVTNKLKELMVLIITDIVNSLEYESELITYLTNLISNKNEFINMTCLLKNM
jgi:hypothetical protein